MNILNGGQESHTGSWNGDKLSFVHSLANEVSPIRVMARDVAARNIQVLPAQFYRNDGQSVHRFDKFFSLASEESDFFN